MTAYTFARLFDDGTTDVVTVEATTLGEADLEARDEPGVERTSCLQMRDLEPQRCLAF